MGAAGGDQLAPFEPSQPLARSTAALVAEKKAMAVDDAKLATAPPISEANRPLGSVCVSGLLPA